MEIKQTAKFKKWLASLKDKRAKAKILIRLKRARQGNLGDIQPVGSGVSEMRIHTGKGYRAYFVEIEGQVILLLCGGSKPTQKKDIKTAKEMAEELRKEPWKYKI